jgi:ubiquinone/menaquinone biosynthesis C-methylase UbiE
MSVAALTYPPIQFLAIPVILYTCIPVIQKAFKKLKQGLFGGDALVVLVFLGAILYGYILLACSVIFIFSIAEKFVLKVREESHNKLVDIFQQVPNFVWIVVDDVELRIPFQELKKILSIGCGEGSECVLFAENGAKIVGIDSSNELIKLAKKNYSKLGIDFLVMDYEETAFEEATFDGIISIMSIMYKADLTKVLLELKRILKPHGTMVIVVPHPVRKMIKYANFDYFASGLHYETWEDVTRYNYYRTLEEYFRLIKESGLNIEKLLEPKPQLDEPYQVTNNVGEHLYPHSLILVLQPT